MRRDDGGCHLRLSEPEAFLWGRIDGHATQEELATAWFLRFGSFEFDRLVAFLQLARRSGFIEMVRGGFLRSRLLPEWPSYEWRWKEADSLVQRLHGWIRPVLHRGFLVPVCGVVLAGLWVVGSSAIPLPPWAPASFAGFWLLHTLPHEAAHAVATCAYGRRVRAVGLSWRGVFVDTTDMYLSDRRARAVVAMAGPVASLVLGSVAAILASFAPDGLWGPLAMMAAWTGFAMAFVSGWPFLMAGDGYRAMCDLVGDSSLRSTALRGLRAGSLTPRQALYVGGVLATWIGLLGICVS